MLSGVNPFYDKSKPELFVIINNRIKGVYKALAARRLGIPKNIVSVIDKCFKVNPSERFESAEEIIELLEKYEQDNEVKYNIYIII